MNSCSFNGSKYFQMKKTNQMRANVIEFSIVLRGKSDFLIYRFVHSFAICLVFAQTVRRKCYDWFDGGCVELYWNLLPRPTTLLWSLASVRKVCLQPVPSVFNERSKRRCLISHIRTQRTSGERWTARRNKFLFVSYWNMQILISNVFLALLHSSFLIPIFDFRTTWRNE